MSQKISDMAAATDLNGAVIPIVQGGANKKGAESLFLPPYLVTGTTANRRHVADQANNTNLSTLVLSINSLRATPFIVYSNLTIDKLGIDITVGAAGKVWVAIYDTNSAGEPSSLIAWSTEQTITAPAFKEGLNVASIALKPGLYWVAYLTDTANIARSLASVNNTLYMVGFPSTIGGVTPATGFSQGLAYQAAPPNPFTAGGAFSAGGFNVPAIFFRAL